MLDQLYRACAESRENDPPDIQADFVELETYLEKLPFFVFLIVKFPNPFSVLTQLSGKIGRKIISKICLAICELLLYREFNFPQNQEKNQMLYPQEVVHAFYAQPPFFVIFFRAEEGQEN